LVLSRKKIISITDGEMVMEYGENDDAPDGVTKWPFYFSALFILALVLGFAYLHFAKHNTLDQWQLVTCILASALASVLVFIPHLLDRFLYLVFDPANRKDEELHRKTYFDIKEMRGNLETLAVKIDKVPSVVDKILSDSMPQDKDADSVLEKLSTDLEESREELLEKIRILQELVEQSPLLPEPDPAIAQTNESIGKLGDSFKQLANQLENLQDAVNQIPTEFPGTIIPEETESTEEEAEPEEEIEESPPTEEPEGTDEAIGEQEDPEPESEEPEPLPVEDSEEEESEAEAESEEEIETDSVKLVPKEEEQEKEESEEAPIAEESEKAEEPSGEVKETEPETDELKLDLPDPEETLRKVDALLAGEDGSANPKVAEEPKKNKSSSGGATSVVANVMIGIGNKPYLRGEGAGLSWDEGVPMNFIEIGKWAWTPTRKNAALTVQVYRNDEDPDKGGKIEVKSGEEIEITPDFS
jgi:hypothetical protein